MHLKLDFLFSKQTQHTGINCISNQIQQRANLLNEHNASMLNSQYI